MGKFICESLEELKEYYFNEPEGEEKISPEERDRLFQIGKEGFEGKQSFTREELISLLEDLFMETAGSYNDYGNDPEHYQDIAKKNVQKFLTDRGL
jgi:hypothetical protein